MSDILTHPLHGVSFNTKTDFFVQNILCSSLKPISDNFFFACTYTIKVVFLWRKLLFI